MNTPEDLTLSGWLQLLSAAWLRDACHVAMPAMLSAPDLKLVMLAMMLLSKKHENVMLLPRTQFKKNHSQLLKFARSK